MNDLLNYALEKCFKEKIIHVVQFRRRVLTHSDLFQSESQQLDIHKRSQNKQLINQHPSCDFRLETELEYSHCKARQKSINDVQLPKIQLDGFKRLFFDHHYTNDSDYSNTKRNKSERQKGSNRSKQSKKGYLNIDISNSQIVKIYKKLQTIFQIDFTRFQLSNFLSQQLGQIDYVSKLLSLLNFPSMVTLPTFKQIMNNIIELQQHEILIFLFQTFDLDSKGFLSITDLFKMFKSDGIISKDADYMFKVQNSTNETSKHKTIRKINLNSERQRPLLITMMKESPKNKNKYKRYLENTINFETFRNMYLEKIPEFFKEFIRLMFYNFI